MMVSSSSPPFPSSPSFFFRVILFEKRRRAAMVCNTGGLSSSASPIARSELGYGGKLSSTSSQPVTGLGTTPPTAPPSPGPHFPLVEAKSHRHMLRRALKEPQLLTQAAAAAISGSFRGPGCDAAGYIATARRCQPATAARTPPLPLTLDSTRAGQ